jgi:hypothetical protein
MSGTAYGTVVLHVSPEAAAGGPLALVRTGDWITLDVPARALTLEVGDDELAARRAQWQPPAAHAGRGWTYQYTPSTCCRLTQGLTWTSWSAPAGTRCRRTRTRPNRRPRSACCSRATDPCRNPTRGSPCGPAH